MDSPLKGQLGGRRAKNKTKRIGFLKVDSPQRRNWAEEELNKKRWVSENGSPGKGNWTEEEQNKNKCRFSENGFSPKGQLGGRRVGQKRSRAMNGFAVRDGELMLWGMKAMAQMLFLNILSHVTTIIF